MGAATPVVAATAPCRGFRELIRRSLEVAGKLPSDPPSVRKTSDRRFQFNGISMPKRPLREKLLATRRHCSAETCLHLSLQIQARFLDGDAYRRAGSVSLYSPFMNEVHTELVARHCLADGKRLAYPRVAGGTLLFVAVSGPEELVPGAFGIAAPAGERILTLDELDLVVIPGVAFDAEGYRLGYGKGYYDRTLSGCPAKLELIGFAYEFQLIERLPAADHDCRLTQLVTEQRTLRFASLGQAEH